MLLQSHLKKAPKAPKGLNASEYLTSRSYYDGYRRKLIPEDSSLINEYKRVIYTCANLNVNRCLSTPLRLYMKREVSGQKTLLRKGIETREIPNWKKDKLQNWQALQKTLRRFVDIEEVLIHPVLDILHRGNRLPFFNGHKLFELGQLYQELIGREYWLIENNVFGIPSDIWLLPSHWVRPVPDKERKVIAHYDLWIPGQTEPISYKPEDVMAFLMPSPVNPYVEGVSPLVAAFDVNNIANKQLSLEANLLDNEGRPDLIISPKQDSAIGPDEAERWEKEYKTRFSRGRTGGIWVMEDAVEIDKLNFPPREFARLEIGKYSKNEICNCYGVPFALISDANHNREQIEAADVQHAKIAIIPRLNRRLAVLNDPENGIIARFDDSGLLFLAYDDPVPENEEVRFKKIRGFVQDGIWTRNEARKFDGTYGEHPEEIADRLLPMNVPSEVERNKSRGFEEPREENGKS